MFLDGKRTAFTTLVALGICTAIHVSVQLNSENDSLLDQISQSNQEAVDCLEATSAGSGIIKHVKF